MKGQMRFSLYLIYFKGVDSLHLFYSAVFAGLPQGLQAGRVVSGRPEGVRREISVC